MALQKQVIDVPFTSGVDTKTDNFLANKLDVLENGFIGQAGTIQKRNGFSELSTAINSTGDFVGTNVTSGELLVRRKDELLVANKTGLYSYTPSEASPWTQKTNYSFTPSLPLVSVSIDQINAARSATIPMSSQMEETTTEEIYAINRFNEDVLSATKYIGNLVRKDKTTGAFYTDSNYQYTTSVVGNTSELAKLGTQVFWIKKEDANIKAYNVTTKSASYASQTLKTDAINNGQNSFFATNVLSNKLVLIYVETGGKIRVVTYTLSGTSLVLDMSYTLSSETEAIAGGFASAYDSVNQLYFFGYTSRNLTARKTKVFTLSNTFTLATGVTQINSSFTAPASLGTADVYQKSAVYDSATQSVHFLFTSYSSTYSYFQVSSIQLELSPINTLYSYTLPGCFLIGNVALVNGVASAPIAKVSYDGRFSGGTTYTAYLANYNLRPVCRISSNFNSITTDGVISRFASNSFVLPYPSNGTVKVTIDTDNVTNSNPVESDGVAIVASGSVNMYDGATYSELGFTHAPTIYYAQDSGGGTGVPAGAYQYRAVYQFIDSQGNYHLSDVSDVASVIIGSARDIELAVEPYRFTNKEGQVTIKLYRKKETDILYKLVGTYDSSYTGIIDSKSDNSSGELLYSDGTTNSVLVNTVAPVSNIVVAHGGRLFAVDEENNNTVWYTKQGEPGTAPAFNDYFFFQIPESKTGFNERVTGLASLDDKLIIFKDNSVYAVFGDGPNDFGQGAFSEPKLISTDVGCSECRSIVNLSEGVMFKSKKGIYILSRALEVVYIGADVEAYNSEEITSACLLPAINQVRFTTRAGVALVYNYFYKQWSTFTNYSANHAVVWKEQWTHLKSSGAVRVEGTGFLDVATPIRLRIKMSWLKASGIQSLQRIWRLMFVGTWKSAHNIVCNLAYDYEEYTWDTCNIAILSSGYGRTDKPTSTQIYSGTNDGIYNFEIHLKRQKCQAISFELYDTDIVGESFSLSGLSLVAGIKNGLDKVSSNKKF